MWRDGMGRVTVKWDTGATPRGHLLFTGLHLRGYVRAPGWLQVGGMARIPITGVGTNQHWRDTLATQARYRRIQRHGLWVLRSRGYGPRPDIQKEEIG